MAETQAPPNLLILPDFVQTKAQVHSLISEVLQIEDFLYKAQVREAGSKMSLPRTTADLDKLAEANKRNVLNHNHRLELAKFLRDVYRLAPEIMVTIGVDADKKFVTAIIAWFRTNVHAQTLVTINNQAKLRGGCQVRIKHKTYDFSLNALFDRQLPILKEALQLPVAQTATNERRSF